MFENVGLYAKAVVAFLATVGAAAQTALSDGEITASEYGVLISVVLGAVGVLLVPNARVSEAPEERGEHETPEIV
jgi:hypothetical protein